MAWRRIRRRKFFGRSIVRGDPRLRTERPGYPAEWPASWTRALEAQWTSLHRVCADRASRTRLARLLDRLGGNDRGALESALAELELATLLVRAGFSVRFLPESQSRTADLECSLGQDRFFVEVTAMVGSAHHPRPNSAVRHRTMLEDREGDGGGGLALINRLLARIAQKARQLVHYCAPVVLAITVPPRERRPGRWAGQAMEELDLKRLAGAATVLLPLVRQVSAVLLSLWDIEPSAARSGVRLANVYAVERPARQTAYPRVRLLIVNPAAGYPLCGAEIETLKGLL